MEGVVGAAAAWLDAAGVRAWAGGPAYPWINTAHLLGLVMLVGGIGVVDLRVLGAWRMLPLPELSRALTPVALAGLAILLPSGLLLFAADGATLAGSAIFTAKLMLIALALANALAFRMLSVASRSPVARVQAAASLALWLTVGGLGRFIAYA